MDCRWSVWMWKAADGRVVYLGCDRSLRGVAPWVLLWQDRYRESEPSAIHRWLREQGPEMPQPVLVGSSPMSRTEAEDLATIMRGKLAEAGHKLLSTRLLKTYRHGGGREKPVEDHHGFEWPSLSAAARAYNIDPGTGTRKIHKGEWSYVE